MQIPDVTDGIARRRRALIADEIFEQLKLARQQRILRRGDWRTCNQVDGGWHRNRFAAMVSLRRPSASRRASSSTRKMA